MVEPFCADGRLHDTICFVCYSVPKMWEYKDFVLQKELGELWEGCFTYHDTFNEKCIRTVEEMMDDGFGKKESQASIRGVLQAYRKRKNG